jgi:hypothetical protein
MTTCHHLCPVVVVEEQVETSAWRQVFKMVDILDILTSIHCKTRDMEQ